MDEIKESVMGFFKKGGIRKSYTITPDTTFEMTRERPVGERSVTQKEYDLVLQNFYENREPLKDEDLIQMFKAGEVMRAREIKDSGEAYPNSPRGGLLEAERNAFEMAAAALEHHGNYPVQLAQAVKMLEADATGLAEHSHTELTKNRRYVSEEGTYTKIHFSVNRAREMFDAKEDEKLRGAKEKISTIRERVVQSFPDTREYFDTKK